jgi:two-component system response regulator FixJ
VANVSAYVGIVDDDAAVRVALSRLLRLAGYEVATFESGSELLPTCARRLPDCVILDVHLPGVSGFDVHSRLRAKGWDPPAVFITAAEDAALADRVRELGGVRLLRKPFTNEALLEAVAAALRTRCHGS